MAIIDSLLKKIRKIFLRERIGENNYNVNHPTIYCNEIVIEKK